MRELPARRRPTPRFDDVYDAFKHPRRDRPALDILDAAGARAFDADGARRAALDVLDQRSISTAATRCSPAGSSTAWSCSTSTSTTRRCWRRSSSWTTSRTRPPTATAAPRAARRRRRATRRPTCSSRAASTCSAPTPTRGPTTTSGPRTWSSSRPFRIDTTAGHQRRVRRVRRRRRLRRPRALDRRRLGVAHRGRAGGAAVLDARRRRRLGPAALRPHRAGARRRAGAARVLVRGRRLRPLVGRAPPHRGRVGERRRAGHARSRGADLWREGAAPRSRPPPVGARRRRRRATHGVHGMLGGVWEWTASDFARPPRVPVVPVPRVLRGVLRPRLQGAARRLVGDAPVGGAHHVPQLGLPDPPPDLLRLPLRARTPDR